MRQKSGPARVASETKTPTEKVMKDIRRATRRHHSAEEKIRVVLEGLRGEESIAELCRREGIATSIYYAWSKEFLEAGKRRLTDDTARSATTGEVRALRREAQALKEVVARTAQPASTREAVPGEGRALLEIVKRFARVATRKIIPNERLAIGVAAPADH